MTNEERDEQESRAEALASYKARKMCELCGEQPIVETADYKDRCQTCIDTSCPRCGGETGSKLIGDEFAAICGDCGAASF